MIYAHVNERDREHIENELKTTKDAKWYLRLKIIQLSSLKQTVPQLTALFEVSKWTIRNYIRSYNSRGLEGLRRQYSSGGPVKIPLNKEPWEELLGRSPSQFDNLNTGARNWTQQMLVQYVELYYGIKVSQSTISTQIKKMGLRWNRGKLKVTSPDPLYTVKRERIETLKKSPGGDLEQS